jgi:hypothetical protein
MIFCVPIIEIELFSKFYSCVFSIEHSAIEIDILGKEFIYFKEE